VFEEELPISTEIAIVWDMSLEKLLRVSDLDLSTKSFSVNQMKV